MEREPNSSSSSESEEEQLPENVIVQVETRLMTSDEDSASQVEVQLIGPLNETEQMIDDVEKSIRRLDTTVASLGLNASDRRNNTLFWDYEGLECSPRKQYVSDGENDKEHLEYLKSLDPMTECEDGLPARIKTFLDNFNRNRQKDQPETANLLPYERFRQQSCQQVRPLLLSDLLQWKRKV